MSERDATHKRSFAEHIRNSGCKSSPLTRFVASKGAAYADAIAEVDEAGDEEMFENEKTKGIDRLNKAIEELDHWTDYLGHMHATVGGQKYINDERVQNHCSELQRTPPQFWVMDGVSENEAMLREERIKSIRARLL